MLQSAQWRDAIKHCIAHPADSIKQAHSFLAPIGKLEVPSYKTFLNHIQAAVANIDVRPVGKPPLFTPVEQEFFATHVKIMSARKQSPSLKIAMQALRTFYVKLHPDDPDAPTRSTKISSNTLLLIRRKHRISLRAMDSTSRSRISAAHPSVGQTYLFGNGGAKKGVRAVLNEKFYDSKNMVYKLVHPMDFRSQADEFGRGNKDVFNSRQKVLAPTNAKHVGHEAPNTTGKASLTPITLGNETVYVYLTLSKKEGGRRLKAGSQTEWEDFLEQVSREELEIPDAKAWYTSNGNFRALEWFAAVKDWVETMFEKYKDRLKPYDPMTGQGGEKIFFSCDNYAEHMTDQIYQLFNKFGVTCMTTPGSGTKHFGGQDAVLYGPLSGAFSKNMDLTRSPVEGKNSVITAKVIGQVIVRSLKQVITAKPRDSILVKCLTHVGLGESDSCADDLMARITEEYTAAERIRKAFEATKAAHPTIELAIEEAFETDPEFSSLHDTGDWQQCYLADDTVGYVNNKTNEFSKEQPIGFITAVTPIALKRKAAEKNSFYKHGVSFHQDEMGAQLAKRKKKLTPEEKAASKAEKEKQKQAKAALLHSQKGARADKKRQSQENSQAAKDAKAREIAQRQAAKEIMSQKSKKRRNSVQDEEQVAERKKQNRFVEAQDVPPFAANSSRPRVLNKLANTKLPVDVVQLDRYPGGLSHAEKTAMLAENAGKK